ncbi:EF-hand domain-containing protein [Gimesia panareensis]|uniref:EF-hand domain-containing protein n=1 Tax=Gimesia panareensis TaxID=2527978 RepID=UPI00118B0E44|nr:EF-hand domain-containing protein [Gimesia panareensis]QDU50559.1 EF hand [Gimesia panareensis]
MQRISPVLALVALFGFSTVSAFAAPDEETSSKEKVFQQLDKNSDGTITADEVPDEKKRFFEFLLRSGDQNKDGKLTKGEFEGGLKKENQKFEAGDERRGNQGPRFYNRFLSRLDRNGDKKISKDELPEPLRERMEPLFQRLNTNEISLEQLERMGNMFGNRRPPRPDGQGMNSKEQSERFFSMLDTNKDGKLTLDEAPERARFMLRRIYEQSGKEREATLTKQEFMEALAKVRPPQRPGRREMDQNRKPAGDNQEMKRPEMENRPDFRRRGFNQGQFPLPAFIKTLDTNNDRKLDQEELKQLSALLEKLDQNKDGALDMRELMGSPNQRSPRDRNRMERPRRPALEQPKDDSKKKESE